jgi:hypothetical protein
MQGKEMQDTIYNLIRNTNDIEDDSNNIILYYHALAFQEVVAETELLSDI